MKLLKSVECKVKVIRAYGGCLGTDSRRRTWQAAISCGEAQAAFDPQISEWGNPSGVIQTSRKGREPGEVKHLSNRRKRNRRDSLSSGERKGKSLNHMHVIDCGCCAYGVVGNTEMARRPSIEL